MDAGAHRAAVDPRLLLTTLGEQCCAVPADIAVRLGVDEEDVRASLLSLERAGFVRHDADGAFSVPPRSAGELRELYVVAVLLEGLALRTCPPFTAEALAELREANERLRASTGHIDTSVVADYEFHCILVRRCANETLIHTHTEAKAALARYDRDYWEQNPGHVERSSAEHDEIIDALEAGDHAAAARVVRRNFERTIPGLASRLDG
jgi:DNA-binding GntR family transcriptional regulator